MNAHRERGPIRATTDPTSVLLLGGSNLGRAVRAVETRLRGALAPPEVRFFSAVGLGRAYCVAGGFLHVRYLPIPVSGVLEAADQRAQAGDRIVALVTDVGNDIMYGVPPDKLVDALRALFARLHEMDARVVTTTIPVRMREDVSEMRYRFLRTVLFPSSSVSYEDVVEAVGQVNRFLDTQAATGVHVLPDLRRYLGYDRIHYSVLSSHRAWTKVTDEMLHALGLESTAGIGSLDAVSSRVAALASFALFDLTKRRSPGVHGVF